MVYPQEFLQQLIPIKFQVAFKIPKILGKIFKIGSFVHCFYGESTNMNPRRMDVGSTIISWPVSVFHWLFHFFLISKFICETLQNGFFDLNLLDLMTVTMIFFKRMFSFGVSSFCFIVYGAYSVLKVGGAADMVGSQFAAVDFKVQEICHMVLFNCIPTFLVWSLRSQTVSTIFDEL